MPGLFSDITTTIIAKSLDVHGLRHKTLANNIANVETPGFTRSDVSFDSQLQSALEQPSDTIARRMIEDGQPEAKQDLTSPAGPNGNNVTIDREMTEMTKNSTEYEALIRLLSMKDHMLRNVITDGKA